MSTVNLDLDPSAAAWADASFGAVALNSVGRAWESPALRAPPFGLRRMGIGGGVSGLRLRCSRIALPTYCVQHIRNRAERHAHAEALFDQCLNSQQRPPFARKSGRLCALFEQRGQDSALILVEFSRTTELSGAPRSLLAHASPEITLAIKRHTAESRLIEEQSQNER